jgi:hypothetical protein
MVFWFIGLNAPIMKNSFEMSFEMSKNIEYFFWMYIRTFYVRTQKIVGIFCGLCKKDKDSLRRYFEAPKIAFFAQVT